MIGIDSPSRLSARRMQRTCSNRDHDGFSERFAGLERTIADQQDKIADLTKHLLHPHQRIVLRHVLARSEQQVISQFTGLSCSRLRDLTVRDLPEGEAFVVAKPGDTRITADAMHAARAEIERIIPKIMRERVRGSARDETHSDDIIPSLEDLRRFREALPRPDDADAVVSLYVHAFPRGIHEAAAADVGQGARGGGGGGGAGSGGRGGGGGGAQAQQRPRAHGGFGTPTHQAALAAAVTAATAAREAAVAEKHRPRARWHTPGEAAAPLPVAGP